MDELFRRLRASANPEGSYVVGEYGHSYKLLTHKDAENIIRYLNQYSEIKKIVDSWNNSDIAGDEQEVSQYFQQILDTFSTDDTDVSGVKSENQLRQEIADKVSIFMQKESLCLNMQDQILHIILNDDSPCAIRCEECMDLNCPACLCEDFREEENSSDDI